MLIVDRQPMLTASVPLVIAGAVLHLWWPSSASVHPAADVRQRSPGLSRGLRYFLEAPAESAVLLPQWPQASRDDFAETPQRRQLAWRQPPWSLEVFPAEGLEELQRPSGAFAQTSPVRFSGTAHFSFAWPLWIRPSQKPSSLIVLITFSA